MGIKETYKRIRHNHLLMMVLCCLVPLTLLYLAVYIFGVKGSYLYWFIILLCPLMHYFMMKSMHKNKGDENSEGNEGSEKNKTGGGCH